MIRCVGRALVSRYGDRIEAAGCKVDKIGVATYRVTIPEGARPFVKVGCRNEQHKAVVYDIGPFVKDVAVFNRSMPWCDRYPGDDIDIQIFSET